LSELVLQEGETIGAAAAAWDKISAMMERGEFIAREALPGFDALEKRLEPRSPGVLMV